MTCCIGGNEAAEQTKELTMEKSSKTNYWAVLQGRDVLFSGSFNDCWKHLTDCYAAETVASLTERGIRIGRVN